MMRALSFPEVQEALRELMEQLREMGMNQERVETAARSHPAEYAGHANNKSNNSQANASPRILSEQPPNESIDGLMNRPFSALSDAD